MNPKQKKKKGIEPRKLTYLFPAGGQAVNSKMQRMLEVVPENIHDRSGIFMGSYDEVEKVKLFHK